MSGYDADSVPLSRAFGVNLAPWLDALSRWGLYWRLATKEQYDILFRTDLGSNTELYPGWELGPPLREMVGTSSYELHSCKQHEGVRRWSIGLPQCGRCRVHAADGADAPLAVLPAREIVDVTEAELIDGEYASYLRP